MANKIKRDLSLWSVITIIFLIIFNTDAELAYDGSAYYVFQALMVSVSAYLFLLKNGNLNKLSTKWLLAFNFLFVLAFSLLSFKNYLVFNGDNFHYLISGRSLYENGQMLDTFKIGTPPPKNIPPLLPFIIALVYKVFGENILIMKTVAMLLYCSSVFFLYDIFKTESSNKRLAIGLSLVSTLSPFLLLASSTLMTEGVYMFASTFGLWAALRLLKFDAINKPFIIGLLILIVGMIFTYGARSVGVCIFPAVLAFYFFRIPFKSDKTKAFKSWDFKKFLLVAGALIIAFGVYTTYEKVSLGSAKTSELSWETIPQKSSENFDFQKSTLPSLVLQNKALRKMVDFSYNIDIVEYNKSLWWVTLIILIGLGYALFKRKLTAFYIVFGFIVLTIAAPAKSFLPILRYMTIFIPFFMWMFLLGIRVLLHGASIILGKEPLKEKNQNFETIFYPLFILSIISFLGLGYGVKIEQQKKEQASYYNLPVQHFFNASKWIGENYPDKGDYEVIARKPRMFHYYSSKYARGIGGTFRSKFDTKKSAKYFDYLNDKKIRFIMVDSFSGTSRIALIPLIQANPDKFKLVHQEGKKQPTYIFEYLK